MLHPIALLLLIAAGAPLPAALPDRAEAAVAWFEQQANACRAMIDVCDSGVGVGSPEEITELECRANAPGHATCRFRVAGHRCRAEFVSAAGGAAYVRARQWSQLPEAPGHAWSVAWSRSPEPRGPRIRCTARPEGD